MKKYKRVISAVALAICVAWCGVSFADFNKSEEDAFYVAVRAFEDGFYDLSLAFFDRFLKAYLESDKKAEAMLYIGQCYFFQEKYLKALDHFEAALKMERASAAVKDKILFWLGEVYAKGKDYTRARAFYEELIRDHRNSFYLLPAYKSLAGVHLKEGRLDDALKTYRAILEVSSDPAVAEEASLGVFETLYRKKEYAFLKEEAEAFMARYPASKILGRVYFFLGEANFYTNRYEDAVEAYRTAEASSSDAGQLALARLGRGWSYLKLKKYDDAQKIFSDFRQEGLSPAVLLAKAVLATAVGEDAQALGLFDAVIAGDKTGEYASAAYVGKAEIHYVLSRYDEAIVAYRAALDKLKMASSIYEENMYELRDKIYYGLAWAHLQIGDFRPAQEAFQKIILQSADKMVRLSALCQLGDTYQDAGDYGRAAATYQDFLIKYPDSIYADYVQYQLGIAWIKMDKLESAVLAFRKLLKEYPGSKLVDDINYFLGAAYFQKGQFPAAEEQLENFLGDFKDSPYRPQALFLLGETRSNLGDHRGAALAFEILLRECADDDGLTQKAEYEAAHAYLKLGQHGYAQKRLADFVTRYPRSPLTPDVIFWLGQSGLEQKNYAQAKGYFEKLIRNYPDDDRVGEAYLNLGIASLEEGDADAALKYFKLASSLGQEGLSAKALFFSADAYLAKQDFEKALEFYRQAASAGGAAQVRAAYIKMAKIWRLRKSYREAVVALEKALSVEGGEGGAGIQFEIAELLEEDGARDEALAAYFKVFYLYHSEVSTAVKSLLRVAKIYEEKEAWSELRGVLEKIAAYDVPEAKFAEEKLGWLKENSLIQ